MGADVFCNTCQPGILAYHALNASSRQPAEVAACVRGYVFAVTNKKGNERIVPHRKVLLDPIGGSLARGVLVNGLDQAAPPVATSGRGIATG